MAAFLIYHDVDLSLTEELIPVYVHVKQFDHSAKKIRCRLYQNSVEYSVPDGTIINCTATRPDGRIAQYASDSTEDYVYVEDGRVVITITDFMTEVAGRFPVDVTLLDEDGDIAGTFTLVLKVVKAAIGNKLVASLTYEGCLAATIAGIYAFSITDDGYLVMESVDGLGLVSGSESGTVNAVADYIEEVLVESSITSDGSVMYTTADALGLTFSVNDDDELVVEY